RNGGKAYKSEKNNGVESTFSLLHGKLCVEIKGFGKIQPNATPNPQKSATENFPLFPEESQFFPICDNFIQNAFQLIQGEYQKYNNRTEE
ncbi:hypothetical protein ABTL53_19425, partial [Acinetobacter baumannii]